jgi:dethiobiotin synthetase
VERLSQALGGEFAEERICPQRFAAPLAPPAAARQEGARVDAPLLRTAVEWWRSRVAVLLVEGVGGLLSPLTESETVADLAVDLGFPLVIVAADRLGTINHTLLALEAARRRGLDIAGIVLNRLTAEGDPSSDSNGDEIERRGGAPILGTLPHRGSQLLRPPGAPATIDWSSLSGFPRH